MRQLFVLSFIFSAFLLALACSDKAGLGNRSLNPNGDKELALLMRAMVKDSEALRKHIESGSTKPLKLGVAVEKITTAEPTEPAKQASETYQTFAAAYIQLAKDLEKMPANAARDQYNSMIATCMGCHQALCPGPMVRIKKLYAAE